MRAKFAKFILLIFSILMGLSLSILILEIYLRANNKFALNFVPPYHPSPDLFRTANDLLVGWEYNPDNTFGFNVNSFGFHDKERKFQKEKNSYRIIIMGDSITEIGYYVSALEELLNKNDLKHRFEVWNSACGGYQLTNYYGLLREKILKFNPDMIIIGFCLNDFSRRAVLFKDKNSDKFLAFDTNIEKYPAYYSFTVNPRLFVKSYAYRFLVIFFQRVIKGNLSQNIDDLEIARWALGSISKITESRNIKLLGVIIPYFKSKYEKYEEAEYRHMKQLLDEYKIGYLDLHGKFPDIDDLTWRLSNGDWIHPSIKGHDVIAREIYNYLLRDLSWWYQKG